jgi:tight adherence protein C
MSRQEDFMGTMTMLPLALVLAGMATLLVYLGVRQPKSAATIEDRLATFSERQYSLEELELAQPFSQRVLAPTFLKVARFFSKFTPRSNTERLRQNLIEAGSPSKLGVPEFLGLKFALAVVCGGLIFVLFAISGQSFQGLLLFPLLVAGIAYLIPGIWLGRKIKARKKSIQLALADAIDLLSISVEAGLGFDPALQRVTEKWDNELTFEFSRMLQEMRIGKSRREAMRELGSRCGVDDLNVFVSAIIQADQLGVSITQVLRTQSKQLRIRRRQRAEELAHKAPIKMLFPMVFLIFPSLYAVILGPAVPRIVDSF